LPFEAGVSLGAKTCQTRHGIWGNVKGTELANRCHHTIDQMAARAGRQRVRDDTDLCFALLRRTGPFLSMRQLSRNYTKPCKGQMSGVGWPASL
jgi:hypothetical protein